MDLKSLRQLDIDDLIIMSLLLEPVPFVEISRYLRLTPPAISHRLRKFIDILDADFLQIVEKNKKVLTKEGALFCVEAKKALAILLQIGNQDFDIRDYCP